LDMKKTEFFCVFYSDHSTSAYEMSKGKKLIAS
jgi:hypothetical protein